MQDQTVLNIFLIFMVLVLFMFTLFLTRVLRRIDSPYEYKNRTIKNSLNKIRANMREGFYEKLTSSHQPFNWRVASALSIAQLSRKDIDRFLSALDKVLKVEKETIRKFDTVNNSKLELILNPFIKKDTVSEIDQAITNFESYYLLEEANADEALEYFINLEVSNFSNEYSRQQGLENDEAPF